MLSDRIHITWNKAQWLLAMSVSVQPSLDIREALDLIHWFLYIGWIILVFESTSRIPTITYEESLAGSSHECFPVFWGHGDYTINALESDLYPENWIACLNGASMLWLLFAQRWVDEGCAPRQEFSPTKLHRRDMNPLCWI